ncbi:MAG: RnfH family protein [Pseudomonadales bacterium]
MSVEVVYALADRYVSVEVELARGAIVEDALVRSGIEGLVEGLDLSRSVVGVFGEVAKLDRVLAPGDRVEIYRALRMDPREARRERVRDEPKQH